MVMYSKWHGQACPVCFDGVLVDGEKSEEMTYQGAVFKYRQRGAFCPTCGNGIVEGGVENDALYKAFRNRVDVTIAEEIEAIREELHIPKAAMKNYIGGRENVFNRYVTQQTRPTVAVWNLMRAMREYPDLVEKLSRPFVEVDSASRKKIKFFDGNAAANLVSDWCSQVAILEENVYGFGNGRSTDLLKSLCLHDGDGFIFAVMNGRVIGTADVWRVSRELFVGIKFGKIPEENLLLSGIFQKGHQTDDSFSLWYLASLIVLPEFRSNARVKSPIYCELCRFVLERVLVNSSSYSVELLGVVSNENGRNMMAGWGMAGVPTATKKDRCEGQYLSIASLAKVFKKYIV